MDMGTPARRSPSPRGAPGPSRSSPGMRPAQRARPARILAGLLAKAPLPHPRHALARFEATLGAGAKRAVAIACAFSVLALAACGSFTASPTVETPQPALADLGETSGQGGVIGLRKHARMAARTTTTVAETPETTRPKSPPLASLETPRAAPSESASALTRLVAFDNAPFPYDGPQPGRGPFLDVERGGQKGHRARNGQILWESETFNDRRVLVHIPEGFDPAKPAVMVVFFHGFGATLARDVRDRQLVPAQVSASGANAVLLAPQFAVDARDGSAGHFWDRGGFARFLDEAAERLARLHGDHASERAFKTMPIALVAYSGGFLPAAYALRDIDHTGRVRGVMLLDAAYGELSTYARWVAKERSGFFVSASTNSTFAQNAHLKQMLSASGVSYSADEDQVGRGVTFLHTGAEYTHRDYVTQAWVKNPISDLLARLPGVSQRDIKVASWKDASIPQRARNRALAQAER